MLIVNYDLGSTNGAIFSGALHSQISKLAGNLPPDLRAEALESVTFILSLYFSFHPIELARPDLVYLCIGGFTVFYMMMLRFFKEKLLLSEALPATIFGIMIGPYGANILNPHTWGDGTYITTNIITLEVMRLTLAMGLFVIGRLLTLPDNFKSRVIEAYINAIGRVFFANIVPTVVSMFTAFVIERKKILAQ
ncbi:hypothetical protein Clacol_005726 [Clathrus columnatus]|uniref:Cation/H+ exchanger domain-containing protein n=1 Tax=Clathrus columnatus TaxID=1419009 RepID=A0AAV5ADD3_9AGAM|nr:hypothetical protein Clacol_005726 [Clathrus columnatus]